QIREREFTWREAVTIVRDVADALAVAHDKGILHRDLKPSNILMDAQGKPHVADFGLAKDTRTGSKYTRTGQTLGTPAYMSPEQARGDLAALTPASDVWALGCVLYELLANRPAFEGDTPAAVVGNVLTGSPQPIPGIPRHVWDLATLCLRRSPGDRPASAHAVGGECRRVLSGLRPAQRIGHTGRRRWVALLAGAAGLGALLVAYPGGRSEPPAETAVAPSEAEQLAGRGWMLRRADRGAAVAALEQALALEPGRDEWILRLGLLQWAGGDSDRARATWATIREEAPSWARSQWFRSIALWDAAMVARDQAALQTVLAAWRALAARGGTEARWAQWGVDFLTLPGDEALKRIGSPTEWEGALLEGIAVTSMSMERSEAPDPELNRRGIRAYTRVVDRGLPIAFVYTNRGTLRSRNGSDDEALRDYDAAIALNPDAPAALASRGSLHGERGRLDDALRDLSRAIALRPDYRFALFKRSLLHLERNEPEWAERDLGTILAHRPADWEARNNRGILRRDRGDHAGAREDFAAAVAVKPESPSSWTELAMSHKRLGEHREALAAFGRSLQLEPENATVWYHRAESRIRTGDAAGALADLREAEARDPSIPDLHWCLSEALERTGDLGGAASEIGKHLRRHPDHPMALHNQAVLRTRLGDDAGAERSFRRLTQLPPGDERLALLQSKAWQSLGDLQRAEEVLSRALTRAPGALALHERRGSLRYNQRRWRAALEDFDRVLQSDDRRVGTLVARGRSKAALGDPAGALEDLERALTFAPRHEHALGMAAMLHEQRRNWARAAVLFRRLIDVLGERPMANDARRRLARCEAELANRR
ncbi:MAG: tetratricopeptide repeat protein, partial [Planctomycetota bacterium]